MPVPKTTLQFIKESKAKFKDKFNYSKTKYFSQDKEVTLTCHEHDDVNITPKKHLKSQQGCPKCHVKITGRKPKSLDQFITDARKKFGDRFDYSEAIYVNNKTPLTIICRIHGTGKQVPSDHLKGVYGCKYCAPKGTALSQSEFIERAKIAHGERYDYSQTVYTLNKNPITIICHTHGPFEQFSAGNHLSGHGCPDCPRSNRVTTGILISRARDIHGDRYNYSETEYLNFDTPIRIICRIHGVFPQLPSHHTAGSNCPKCVQVHPYTNKEFIDKCILMHGDTYDYRDTVYNGAKKNITYKCTDHGEITQQAYDHASGIGCAYCGGVGKYTTEMWIERAKAKHGAFYSYLKTNYVNKSTEVIITCPDHGDFPQEAGSHLLGRGCSSCANYGFDSKLPGTLYLLRSINYKRDIIKIGISNYPDDRIKGLRTKAPFEFELYECFEFNNGKNAFDLETQSHDYGDLLCLRVQFDMIFDGYTEWFEYDKRLTNFIIKHVSEIKRLAK